MITTHYIDEAKQSNLVGFLQDGAMLAEESPQHLMDQLECKTLEDVFYKLCMAANQGRAEEEVYEETNNNKNDENNLTVLKKKNVKHFKFHNGQNGVECKSSPVENGNGYMDSRDSFKTSHTTELIDHKVSKCSRNPLLLNWDHMSALLRREVTLFKAQILIFLFMQLFIPIISVWFFYLTYGRTSRNIPVAIVNVDTPSQSADFLVSDVFLEHFNTNVVQMRYYENETIAFETVKRGHNLMAICFRESFTHSFIGRYMGLVENGSLSLDAMADQSVGSSFINDPTMHIYKDVSHVLNLGFVNQSILIALQDTIKDIGQRQGVHPSLLSLPLEMREFFYGSMALDFQSLFMPGVILLIVLAVNMWNGALKVCQQSWGGCLQRDLSQGVKPNEFLLSIHTSLMVYALVQVSAVIVFSFHVLHARLYGNIWLVFILTLMAALNGIAMGSLIAIMFKNYIGIMVSYAGESGCAGS